MSPFGRCSSRTYSDGSNHLSIGRSANSRRTAVVGIVGTIEVDGTGAGVAWAGGTTGVIGAGAEEDMCACVGATGACVWAWAWVTGADAVRGVGAGEPDAVVGTAPDWIPTGVEAALGYVPASIALMVVPSVRS